MMTKVLNKLLLLSFLILCDFLNAFRRLIDDITIYNVPLKDILD